MLLEQLLGSFKVMIIGMGTVFVALTLLICVVQIINIVINGRSILKIAKPSYTDMAFERVEKVEKDRMASEQSNKSNTNNPEQEEQELIAVISAAVAASLNRSTHDIVVRSIRRIPYHSPAWNQASRHDQIDTRF